VRRNASGISCLVAIDKPAGMTSHDVVAHVRRAVGERRVGHAGTLDPLATGLLVVGIGPATRLLGMLSLSEKRYEACICFGKETTTDDRAGDTSRVASVPQELLNENFASEALGALVGKHNQVPPAYSAISIEGRRAYARARAGERVVLAPRPIQIYDARLLALDKQPDGSIVWRCEFSVSKGTYIRSLARDLGRKLQSAAYLLSLRRIAAGSLSLDACVPLAKLEAKGAPLLPCCCVDPAQAAGLPVRLLDAAELSFAVCGKRIPAGRVADPAAERRCARTPRDHEQVCLVFEDRLYGIWEARQEGLVCKVNFPGGVSGVRQ
jgi:tRNA pseudouridine55 synthase